MKTAVTEQTSQTGPPRGPFGRLVPAALLTTLLIGSEDALACPVCFGDPDSEMTRGAMWAILALGIIVYGVLMSMVGVGVTWFLRARKHDD